MDESTISVEEALYDRLGPAVRRQSWLWRWKVFASVMVGAAGAALVLSLLEDRLGWGGRGAWVALAVLILAALALAYRWGERRALDLVALARRIERAQPELGALLLTAVSQTPARPDGRFGYLQEQVMRQAVLRAEPRKWRDAIPAWRLWLMGGACAAGTALFLLIGANAILPELPNLFPDSYKVAITPGDTEAERGTTVLVLARFAGDVPSRATLILRARGKAPVRVDMNRSLADPVFAAATPPIEETAEYQVEYAGRRTRRFRVVAYVPPDLDRLDARIVYPRQPSLPAKEVQDVRSVSVAQGGKVTLTFRLNKEVAEAYLTSEDKGKVVLGPAGGKRDVQTVTLSPDRSHRYELHLLDDRRRPNRTPARLTVEVHANGAPLIALSFPGRDVRVSPLEEMLVEAKISDDVALNAYGVTYLLSRQKPREVRLGGGPDARAVTARLTLPLEDMGARPDDLLSYYFWAEDVDGGGERRRTASDMYFAEVRPFEEEYREGAAPDGAGPPPGGGQQGGGDLARRQKDIINATWRLDRMSRDGASAETLAKDVQVVKKGQGEVKDQAEQSRARFGGNAAAALEEAILQMVRVQSLLDESLPRSLEAEQAAYAALLRLRPREHQVARGRAGQQGSAQDSDRALDELELKQKESRYETQSQATAQDQPAREDRQVLSRLRELAERQKTLTERIKELQLALQQAKPQEREELERRLKRLREEQQEMLAGLDELLDRMDRPENRSRMAEARSALEETRARAAEASQALARGETSRAVGAGTRAERAIDRVREEMQRKVSRAFADEMRQLRAEARRLSKEQEQVGQGVRKEAQAGKAPSLPTESRRLAQAMRAQRQGVSALLERMRKLTEQAEPSAPLLSRKLYDSLRKAKVDGLEKTLDRMGDLLDHNLGAQAGADEERARQGVADLEKGVGEAAKGVLGDESEGLRLAQAEIGALLEQARRERQGPPGGQPGAPTPGAPGQPGAPTPGQPGAPTPGQPGQSPGRGTRPTPGNGGGAGSAEAPITGGGFRSWADRLRDVEELIGDPGLRTDAARIRDRARALRDDFRRKGEPPRWELVDSGVIGPLTELRDRVSEELRRVAPEKDKLAPIDRDPVPSRYSDLVRRYYKSLAGE